MSNSDVMVVTHRCPVCRKVHVMEVPAENYLARQLGAMLQDAYKDFNPMERVFLDERAGGYCPECQKMIFGTDYTSDKIMTEEEYLEAHDEAAVEAAL